MQDVGVFGRSDGTLKHDALSKAAEVCPAGTVNAKHEVRVSKTKERKIIKAAGRLHKPAMRYLRAQGVQFSQPTPSIKEVASKLIKLHPELTGKSRHAALTLFDHLHHEKLGPFWFGTGKKKFPARQSKAEFDAFYSTKAWRQLRFKALLKYGRKCMCCHATDAVMHVDHIKPRSKFPELELSLDNLQILCEDCNMGKGGWSDADFRDEEPLGLSEFDPRFREMIGRAN